MKRNGRSRLFVSKMISNGRVHDRFTVITSSKDADSFKKVYENMGYDVRKMEV